MLKGKGVCEWVCVGVIYTNKLIAAVPSVLRETLSSCLSAILWPGATTAGHLQLHQTKELPQAPSECRYDTASELHGSQGWELIGHFMAASLSSPLSSEEVSTAIKALLHWENWLRLSSRGGNKDSLHTLTSDSFISQSDYLMFLYSIRFLCP